MAGLSSLLLVLLVPNGTGTLRPVTVVACGVRGVDIVWDVALLQTAVAPKLRSRHQQGLILQSVLNMQSERAFTLCFPNSILIIVIKACCFYILKLKIHTKIALRC